VSAGADVVTVVSPAPVVVREARVTAGAVTAVAEVVEVRTVEAPATVVTVVQPINVAIVQSGPWALTQPSGGDATYSFYQQAPAAEWRIPHPLHKRPAVSVQDSAGNLVVGEVRYLGDDLVVVRFLAPFSGRADLN
jgi:hypothetical protein